MIKIKTRIIQMNKKQCYSKINMLQKRNEEDMFPK